MSNFTQSSKWKTLSSKLAWEIVLAVWVVMGILSIIIYVVNTSMTKMEEVLYQEILLHTKETVADKMKIVDADDLDQVADVMRDADTLKGDLERIYKEFKNRADSLRDEKIKEIDEAYARYNLQKIKPKEYDVVSSIQLT